MSFSDVTWTDLSNCVTSGSSIRQNTGPEDWSAGAASIDSMAPANGSGLQFTLGGGSPQWACGLLDEVNDFQLIVDDDDHLYVIENNVEKYDYGIITGSEVFSLIINGSGYIEYKVDGSTIYTSTTSITGVMNAYCFFKYISANWTLLSVQINGSLEDALDGGSSSGGKIAEFYEQIMYGGSTSSGTLIIWADDEDMSGHSNSEGIFAIDLIERLKGSSSSGGTIVTDLESLLSAISLSSGIFVEAEAYHDDFEGGSTSGGVFAITFDESFKGLSTSGGTLTEQEIQAVSSLITYVLNLDTKRTYQFNNYNFTGIGRFNDVLIGKKGNEVYDLETQATDDDGTPIVASMDFGKLDFGVPNFKEARGIYVECDDGENVTVTVTPDEKTARTFTVGMDKMRGLPNNLNGKRFAFTIENIDGKQIKVRRIHQQINILSLKGK
jgi:hypothetical protein